MAQATMGDPGDPSSPGGPWGDPLETPGETLGDTAARWGDPQERELMPFGFTRQGVMKVAKGESVGQDTSHLGPVFHEHGAGECITGHLSS